MVKQIKSISMVIVVGVSILLGTTGCKREPSIVGTWVADPLLPGSKSTLTYMFRSDGTFEDRFSTEPYHRSRFVRTTSSGTYKLDRMNLLITRSSDHSESVNSDGTILKKSDFAQTYTVSYTIEWMDPNRVRLVPPKELENLPTIFNRQTAP
jgi:hypothetical protein